VNTEDSSPKEFLGLADLLFILFFLVCGGAYGIEALGSALPPLFALLGVLLCPILLGLPLALATGELASTWPSQEGYVYWAERAFGPLVGFVEGWNVVLIIMIDKALYPLLFLDYLELLVELTFWEKFACNMGFIVAAYIITILGTKWIGNFSKIFAAGVLLPMGIYTVLALLDKKVDLSRWGQTTMTGGIEPDYGVYTSVLVWLYSGFDYAGFLATEVKDPSTTYPRAMILMVILSMLTYILPLAASLAVTTDVSYYIEGSFPTIASEVLGWGDWLRYLLIGGALFSNLGVYLVYIHTSSNALAALGEKGDAPSIFAKKLPLVASPWVAITFYSFTTIFWTLFDFSVVVEVETVLYCVHAIVLVLTFFRLRISDPDTKRPFRIPGPLVVLAICFLPAVGIALVNIIFTHWFEMIVAFGLLVFLVSCYFTKNFYNKWKNLTLKVRYV